MAQEEQVLVVERKVVEEVGMFQGVTVEAALYQEAFFAPGAARFMRRSEAEVDASYKQLIPYVIMACGGRYLSYVRGKRAGESRLTGLRSIGIGGHINPGDDMPLFDADFRETYRAAVEREVAEEVDVRAGHSDRIVGLLNDDSNEVGSVHIGVVHLWELDSEDVSRREQMITQMSFMSRGELEEVRESMETWSQLCLDNLGRMVEAGKG